MAQPAPNDGISPTQARAVLALLVQPDVASAASAANVAVRSLYRWLRDDPDFQREYARLRREATRQAIAAIQQTAGGAARVLAEIAADKDAPPSARVAAASKILDLAIKAVELEDLDQRLTALEAVPQIPVVSSDE